MTSPAVLLRERAERYRRLASTITDERTVQALKELAACYEAEARRLEAEHEEQGRAGD